MLQSQINPHFLFNTLNTIASLVRTDPEKARILLREFAVFYRRTLENAEDLIVLSREIEQTQRYFMFEIARFGEDRVALEIDVDEPMLDILVPAFILQPLVENALYHGIKLKRGMGHIYVTGRAQGQDILLQVTDDGVGMPPEQIEQLVQSMEGTKRIGFGLSTVHERIRLFFGPPYGLSLSSQAGVGTTISIIIPRRVGEEEKI